MCRCVTVDGANFYRTTYVYIQVQTNERMECNKDKLFTFPSVAISNNSKWIFFTSTTISLTNEWKDHSTVSKTIKTG